MTVPSKYNDADLRAIISKAVSEQAALDLEGLTAIGLDLGLTPEEVSSAAIQVFRERAKRAAQRTWSIGATVGLVALAAGALAGWGVAGHLYDRKIEAQTRGPEAPAACASSPAHDLPRCITAQARLTDNPKLCLHRSITGWDLRDCMNRVVRAAVFAPQCAELSLDAADACYYALATNAKDVSYCAKIHTIDTRDDCFSVIAENQREYLCGAIHHRHKKETCVKRHARVLGSPLRCGELESDARLPCLEELAQHPHMTVELCESLSTFPRDNCLMEIALRTRDRGFIEKVCPTMRSPSECWKRMGMAFTDVPFCEQTSETHSRDHCLEMAARTLGKPEICEKISLGHFRTNCFSSLARELGSPDLCKKIRATDDRKRCLEYIPR